MCVCVCVCVCAAIKKDLVSLVRFPFLSHEQISLCAIPPFDKILRIHKVVLLLTFSVFLVLLIFSLLLSYHFCYCTWPFFDQFNVFLGYLY